MRHVSGEVGLGGAGRSADVGSRSPCAPRLLRACPVVRHASNGKAGTPGQDPQDVPASRMERETGFEPATLSLGS